jgi:hypothetical protein
MVLGSTLSGKLKGNLVISYNEVEGCDSGLCTRSGSHNLVLGPNSTAAAAALCLAHILDGDLAVLLGGQRMLLTVALAPLYRWTGIQRVARTQSSMAGFNKAPILTQLLLAAAQRRQWCTYSAVFGGA